MARGEVLVYAEAPGGTPSGMTLELLGVGRSLADASGVPLAVALLGRGVETAASELGAYGANRVYLASHPDLENYRSDLHLRVLQEINSLGTPSIILFGQDSTGRDLAPRLAARLGAGLTPDCVELALDPQSLRLLATRPIYGGNLRAILAMDNDPQIATLRPKVVDAAVRQEGHQAEIISLSVASDPATQKVKLIEQVKEKAAGLRLEDAEIIVTGGRGIEDEAGVRMIEGLAEILGAAVGATRGSVDAGLFKGEQQVGLTGKMVAPRLYFAVGVSGSMQHLAGCGGSKNIIAINTDPNAPIFQRAAYGIVGDFRAVVPTLTARLKEML